MIKFVTDSPSYAASCKFLPYFIFKGKVYNVGSEITFNKNGKIAIGQKFTITKAWIQNHYFRGPDERWDFRFYTPDIKGGIHGYDFMGSSIDSFIECVNAEPVDGKQEFIEYVKNYRDNYYSNRATPEEVDKIMFAFNNNIPLETVIPERLKGNFDFNKNTEKMKPIFKDWEIPKLMLGWVVFIIFFIGVEVFKDWYISLTLRLVGSWCFGLWRQQKVWGIK